MAITPSTDLMLIKCPLEIDNKNQITFSSASEQAQYFASLPHLRVEDFTYQRHDGVIRYNAHIDSLLEYNYVMYRNINYSSKYFYAFIQRMEYVSDNVTMIYIKGDPYQTWMFDLDFKKSFVEREHVNDDTVGKHLIEENLELGDFVINGTPNETTELSETFVALISSTYPDGKTMYTLKRGELVDGLTYHAYMVNGSSGETALERLKGRLELFAENGYLNNIVAIASMPVAVLGSASPQIESSFETLNVVETTHTYSRNTSLDGYTPKNNKLLCGNYNFILVDNNSGACAKYNYEYFNNPSSPSFRTIVTGGIGCSNAIYPYKYKGTSGNNMNEGLIGGKYATCAFTGDAYTNWLSQTSLNRSIGYGASVAEMAVGIGMVATGAGAAVGAGLIAAGVGGVFSQVQQQHDASFMPPQSQLNDSNGDLNGALGKNTFIIYKMSITKERAKIIDDFLSMFGYKVNSLKVPNTTGRRNWNYIKTIDANIEAMIPQEDIEEIKAMFNSGVTLWHHTNTFLDYSQNNDII